MDGETLGKTVGQPSELSGASLAGWRWYVIEAHPRREAEAYARIRECRFDAFLPRERYHMRVNGRGRIEPRTRALFPGYLFVRLDLRANSWVRVLHRPGVASIIKRADGCPIPVRRGDVETLRAAHDAEGGAVKRLPPVQLGAEFIMPAGLLMGRVARVTGLREIDGEFIIDFALDTNHGRARGSLSEADFGAQD